MSSRNGFQWTEGKAVLSPHSVLSRLACLCIFRRGKQLDSRNASRSLHTAPRTESSELFPQFLHVSPGRDIEVISPGLTPCQPKTASGLVTREEEKDQRAGPVIFLALLPCRECVPRGIDTAPHPQGWECAPIYGSDLPLNSLSPWADFSDHTPTPHLELLLIDNNPQVHTSRLDFSPDLPSRQ